MTLVKLDGHQYVCVRLFVFSSHIINHICCCRCCSDMAKRRSKKKNTGKNWLIFIPVILIGVGSLIYIWYKVSKVNHAKFVRYPAFGIDIPDSYEIHGIDVSKYQSYIDWPSVKEMKVQDVRIG